VTNNTGPMHLSVACQCPTFGLFFNIDMARWGHHFSPHVMFDVTPIENPETVVAQQVNTFAEKLLLTNC
jgi:ADP-heptose:LPS heptosyltransferase